MISNPEDDSVSGDEPWRLPNDTVAAAASRSPADFSVDADMMDNGLAGIVLATLIVGADIPNRSFRAFSAKCLLKNQTHLDNICFHNTKSYAL